MGKMTEDLETYFSGFIPRRDRLLLDLEREAESEGIPIVGPVVGTLLGLLCRVTGARRILELGTAAGYSAIFLARGAETAGGSEVTLEVDGRRSVGRGSSTDIIEASARAYVNALNRHMATAKNGAEK